MTVQESTICKLIQTFPVLLILAQNHNRCLKTPLIYKPPTPTHSPEYYEALDALFHNLYGHGYHNNHGNHDHQYHNHNPTCYHGYSSYGHGHEVINGHEIHGNPCYGYGYGYPHEHPGYNHHGHSSHGSGGYGYHTFPVYVYKKTLNGTGMGHKGNYAPNQIYNLNHKYKIVVKRNKSRPHKIRAEKITGFFPHHHREDRRYGSIGFQNILPDPSKIHSTLTGILHLGPDRPKTSQSIFPFFNRQSTSTDGSNQYGRPYYSNDNYQNGQIYQNGHSHRNSQNGQNFYNDGYQKNQFYQNGESNPHIDNYYHNAQMNNQNEYTGSNQNQQNYNRPQNLDNAQTNYNYQDNRPNYNEPVRFPEKPNYELQPIVVIEYEDDDSESPVVKPVVFPGTNPSDNSNNNNNNNSETNLPTLTPASKTNNEPTFKPKNPSDLSNNNYNNNDPLSPIKPATETNNESIFKPVPSNENSNYNPFGNVAENLPTLTPATDSNNGATDNPFESSDKKNNNNNNNIYSINNFENEESTLLPLKPVSGDNEMAFKPQYQNNNTYINTTQFLPPLDPVTSMNDETIFKPVQSSNYDNYNPFENIGVTLPPLQPIPANNEDAVFKPIEPESVFKPPKDTTLPLSNESEKEAKDIPFDLIFEEERNAQMGNVDGSSTTTLLPVEPPNDGSSSKLPPLNPVDQATLPPLSPVPANPTDSRNSYNPFHETCSTVDGGYGRCVLIFDCPPYLQILRKSRSEPGLVQVLRRAHCGFEGNDPKVCCPLPDFPTPPTNPETPSTTPSTTTTTSTTTTSPPNTTLDSEDYIDAFPEPPVCGFSNASNSRVVGGVNANLGDFPWLALLGYNSRRTQSIKWLCGGALISHKHILTAAHCIHGRESQLYVVRLGELDLAREDDGATPIDLFIKKMIAHENYSANSFTNDIGILVLQQTVTFTDLIRPICVPRTPELRSNNYENYRPLIAGWGDIEFHGPAATHLQVLQLPVVTNEYCAQAYSRYKAQVIDERVLCAGFKNGGKDACQGDSGGPLMQPIWDRTIFKTYFYQIGVVSFGKKCAEAGFPGVYTRITHFVPWLEKTLLGAV